MCEIYVRNKQFLNLPMAKRIASHDKKHGRRTKKLIVRLPCVSLYVVICLA